MSTKKNEAEAGALNNAGEIIDRFGGIRPMAKKTGVAVTTIQGWKKRDVIPGGRKTLIISAASEHGIDLSGLASLRPAPSSPVLEAAKPVIQAEVEKARIQEEVETLPPVEAKIEMQEAAQSEIQKQIPAFMTEGKPENVPGLQPVQIKRNTTTWINASLLVLALVAGAVLYFSARETPPPPMPAPQEESQSFLKTLIPGDLNKRIEELQGQAAEAQQQAAAVMQKAEAISNEVLATDAGTLEDRMAILQTRTAELFNSPEMIAFSEKLQTMYGSVAGQDQVKEASAAIASTLSTIENSAAPQIEYALETARGQSAALNQTFEGVPQNELKAAALLVGFTQFREALNRGSTPFADDLQILKSLVGDQNQELLASIDALAPQAEQGVLTVNGLASEFRTVAGDAAVASMQGQDANLAERAKARMNELIQIRKDGDLLNGTDAQTALAHAGQQLESGDINAAIATVEGLQGPEAQTMAPWLEQARATREALRLRSLLEQTIYNAQKPQGDLIPGANTASAPVPAPGMP